VEHHPIRRREFVHGSLAAAGSLGIGAALPARSQGAGTTASDTLSVVNYGAKGDGSTRDTRAIQAAIDVAHQRGGAAVVFPPGRFLSGSVQLKTGVALHLDHGATLLASKDPADFNPYEKLDFKNAADKETSFFHHALVWAENAERIAITGTGTIHGNRQRRGGPKPIAFKRCKFVTIDGITILDSPNYCISLLGTDYVVIDSVTILNGFADGIDPDCCRHVRIANCHIESWDDAIVPKASYSLGERRSTENLTVTNCILASNCNAFKLGTESGGDFKNITISNCTFFSHSSTRLPISGIALLSVDGSNIDGVAISNIAMADVRCPIFLRLGNRGRDMPTPVAGTLKNIVMSNIVATNAQWPCAITGIPGHLVEGVALNNLQISYRGGGTREQSRAEVPEVPAKYPTADMFKVYPAYGFWCRHARNIHLSSVRLHWTTPDARPAVACDDVSNLSIDGLSAPQAKGGYALLHFHEVRDALIRGCRPEEATDTFLQVSGAASKRISLLANDFSSVRQPVELAADASKQSVAEVGNHR